MRGSSSINCGRGTATAWEPPALVVAACVDHPITDATATAAP